MSTASKSNRTTHTPGPWTVETQWASDVDDNQFPFAHWIAGPEGEQIAEQILEKPDAHLIAAAPDLLAALKAIRTYCSPHMECTNQCNGGDEGPCDCEGICPRNVVDAAIAKAEGR